MGGLAKGSDIFVCMRTRVYVSVCKSPTSPGNYVIGSRPQHSTHIIERHATLFQYSIVRKSRHLSVVFAVYVCLCASVFVFLSVCVCIITSLVFAHVLV